MWKEPGGDPSGPLPGHQLSTLPAPHQALLPVAGTQGSGDSSLPGSQRLEQASRLPMVGQVQPLLTGLGVPLTGQDHPLP